ncbi:MAG: TonB-dependent receptor, partial [Pseudomonadota bacterium]
LSTMAPMNAALAQDQGDDENAQSDESEIVVIGVGSRRDGRSAADTTAPVDVISSDELLNQGDTDIQNILRTSIPSYNVNTQPISDAATLIRPANLRGLPPDNTLVLVNGKRRHRAAVISFLGGGISDGSQGPDISVIPAIAIKQLEVLRDGASSQYGSDAIAGVINFALRDNDSGFQIEADYGSTYAGDGDQYSISANLGLPINIADGGFLNLSAEYGEIDATSRSVQRDDALGLIAAGNTDVSSIDVNTVTDEVVQIWGQPNVNDDFSFFANFGIDLSDSAEIYAFGNYAQRNVDGGFFYRNPNTRGGVFSNDGGETLLVGDLTADGSGACPTVNVIDNVPDPTTFQQVLDDPDCFVFNELFPGGFTPRFGGDLQDQSVVAGVRGDVGKLGYDVSFTYGENDVSFFINNTVNASLGPNTPTSFTPGGYNQRDLNANVDFVYGISNSMFASDINLAFGAEFREEQFTITAGDPASYELGPLAAPSEAFPTGQGFGSSSNGFGGFTPASAGTSSQQNYAFYVDTEFDVTDNWTVQGALRYEDFYNSFGDTLNYKIGTLYRLSDSFAVRGTWSTGFKAPTAGQANVSNVTTAFTGGVLQDQGTIPLSSGAGQFVADSLEASTGVRPTLTSETSQNFTAGVAFNIGNIDFTVDYFNIKVDDRIAISDQQDFFQALSDFATANGQPFGDDVTTTSQAIFTLSNAGLIDANDFAGSEDLASFGFFTNSFDTRTQGIDFVASTDVSLYQGSETDLSLAFNWTDTEVTDRGLDSAAPLSLGRATQLEDNLPATRGNFTVNHFDGPLRGLIRVNYFGEFFECHLDSTNDAAGEENGYCDLPIFAGEEFTVDVEGSVTINDKFEIVAGAQNVFDNYPDVNPFAGIVGSLYPTTAPSGFSGGLYYVKLRASF